MRSRKGVGASSYVKEAMLAFDRAIVDLDLWVPGAGRLLVKQWLAFYAGWKGRRVAGFKNPQELAVKLLADSFAFSFIKASFPYGQGVDLGSGNGWPGLALGALGLVSPVFLLDSRQGACDFLNRFLEESELPGLQVICKRAEEAGQEKDFREKFSLTVSRAMSRPGMVLELCSGLLSVGGKAVLWLGPGQEVPKDEVRLALLGMAFEEIVSYALPQGAGKRHLVVYKKRKPLDGKFPRRYAAISKTPLI